MMKHALQILEQLSPRLCRLLSQIWDLTSLNFFVLIQLAQSTIEGNEQLHMNSKNAEHFHQEMMAQQTLRMQRHEADLEKMRLESRELRAELQKTRQKQNRLAVENSQLRQAISGIVDNQDPLTSGGSGSSGFIAHIDFEEDTVVVSDAEEREFYGVNGDELEKVEKIHPIESFSQDLEQLFHGLFEQERSQMSTLNDLDRFINSNSVSLLWRYGSSEEEHRMMQKMMSARTISTQTEQVDLERRHPSDTSTRDAGNGNGDMDRIGAENEIYASGETGNATMITKRQVIPTSLRDQLETRPKIQRVLEKDHLNRVLLRLYLDKLESDAIAIRARKPRTPLHFFMKQFFLERYGIARLADYHMMEVVKSCLYYHEHQESEHRQIKGLGLAASSHLVGCYPTHEKNLHFSAADIRVALFSRVCELVPLELADVPVHGNLFSCAFNALVDVVSDVIELDPSTKSLGDVYTLPGEERWECSSELAHALLSHHLEFADHKVLEDANARIAHLATPSATQSGTRISVDTFLAIFVTTWFEYDQRLTKKLRDGFRRQLMTLSPFGAMAGKSSGKAKDKHDQLDADPRSSEIVRLQNTMNAAPTEPPLESLMRICAALPDELLSPLDLDELRTNIHGIVEVNQSLSDPGRKRRKSSLKKGSIALAAPASVCIGGVSEKEFVFTVLQCLRARRNCYGIRTNSRLLPATKMNQVCTTKTLAALKKHEHDAHIPLEKLKPGLERRSAKSATN